MKKLVLILLFLSAPVWGETIFDLVERNRVEEVQTELEAHPEWIEKKQHQVTLLHVACFNGSRSMTELLLNRTASAARRLCSA